jgi:hypothetical protein
MTESLKLPSPGPKEFWEDNKWANDNITEIVKQHPDQWVAVVGKKVVAAGKDPAEVERITVEKTGHKEFVMFFVEKGVYVYQG